MITAVTQWFNHNVDLPAAILLIIFALMAYVLYKTQASDKNNFDFADMLRDDLSNKPSSSRLAMFVCLGISTWAIMYILITKKGDIDTWLFIAYVGIWSGAKVAEKGMDMFLASKGVTLTNTQQSSTTTTQTVTAPVNPNNPPTQ
jgi:hypothetical protein